MKTKIYGHLHIVLFSALLLVPAAAGWTQGDSETTRQKEYGMEVHDQNEDLDFPVKLSEEEWKKR
ncbi:MAG: hypothetical protein ACLFRY_14555, partial [Spirochaetia bacterium]